MKNITICFILTLILSGCSATTSDYNEYDMITDANKVMSVSLIEAATNSDLIIKVKINDDLTEKNSFIEKDSSNINSYSIRNSKVIDVLSGNYTKDSISIVEPVAIDGSHHQVYQKFDGAFTNSLKKDCEYTLFLEEFSQGKYAIKGYGTARIDYDTEPINNTYSLNNEVLEAISHKERNFTPSNGLIKALDLQCTDTSDTFGVDTNLCTKYLTDETYIEIDGTGYAVDGKI